MQKILIADDEARIRDILKEYLDFEGFSYDEERFSRLCQVRC